MYDGTRNTNFAPADGAFVDRFSSRLTPTRVSLCRIAGSGPDPEPKCNLFWSTRAVEPYHLRAPEQLEVKAADGSITSYSVGSCPAGLASDAAGNIIVSQGGGSSGVAYVASSTPAVESLPIAPFASANHRFPSLPTAIPVAAAEEPLGDLTG